MKDLARKLLRRPAPLVGTILLGLFVFCALFGPALAPFDPEAQNLNNILAGPSGAHWFGTDENGCDLFSQFLYGCRLSGKIAAAVLLISFTLGVSLGTLAASLVHPREVFKAAIIGNAAAIIVIHNHPSGDPTPSREDREITARLKSCGETLGIPVLDHIVVAAEGYRSFAEMGLL